MTEADVEAIVEPVRRFFAQFLDAPVEACLQIVELPVLFWSGGTCAVLESAAELARYRDEHRLKAAQAGYSRGHIEALRVMDHGPSSAVVSISSTRASQEGQVRARVETFMLLRHVAGEWRIFVTAEKEAMAVD